MSLIVIGKKRVPRCARDDTYPFVILSEAKDLFLVTGGKRHD